MLYQPFMQAGMELSYKETEVL